MVLGGPPPTPGKWVVEELRSCFKGGMDEFWEMVTFSVFWSCGKNDGFKVTKPFGPSALIPV